VLAGVALAAIISCERVGEREIHSDLADGDNPYMQLAPYREGMTLRQVYDTFPRYGEEDARLRILVDNNQAWLARWQLLESAEQSIDISYFILKQDIFGVALLGALLKKAGEGVHIRILLDAYGTELSSSPKGNDYLDTLINTGNVEVRMYRPWLDRALDTVLNMSVKVAVSSEHDKILVVDGKRAITGGRNVAVEYFAHPEDADMVFEDLDIEIFDRQVARGLTAAFEAQYAADSSKLVERESLNLVTQRGDLELVYQGMAQWLSDAGLTMKTRRELQDRLPDRAAELLSMKCLRKGLTRPLAPYITAETRILDSTARYEASKDTITRAAQRLIASAREEVFIVSPYTVLPEDAAAAVAQASQPEVPIVLLTNSPAASESVTAAAFLLAHWADLLAVIPNLELYGNATPQMIHSKVATFDGVVSLVGTYNVSPLSMATNSEVVLAVWSREFADRLTQRARAHLAAGEPEVYHYRIARRPDGAARLAEDGQPVPVFGPLDHFDLESQPKLDLALTLLKAVEAVPGVSPLY
jgi:phosphatidylserine/phosphatidylglycerophosphate/cardiolipin synthase-like enzyme